MDQAIYEQLKPHTILIENVGQPEDIIEFQIFLLIKSVDMLINLDSQEEIDMYNFIPLVPRFEKKDQMIMIDEG